MSYFQLKLKAYLVKTKWQNGRMAEYRKELIFGM